MIQRRERLVGCEVKLCGKVYDPDEDWVDLILAVELVYSKKRQKLDLCEKQSDRMHSSQ
jgi:hypothetical protein